jgi:hypothetical protein
MYQLKRRVFPAIVAGVLGIVSAKVMAEQPATQPSAADLQSQIQQLKTQVASLQANQQQSQADEALAVQQVVSDADQRSQLLDAPSGITAGWDAANYKFWIGSDDGNFLFHPGFLNQVRYASSYRDTPHNFDDGFEIRRLKLYADGNVFGKDITYKVQLQNTDTPSTTALLGGTMYIEYAWTQYVFYHGSYGDLALRAGQMKNPVYHEEEAVADNSQLMVERSLADNLAGGNALSGPYVEGVDVQFTGNKNPLHTHVLFTNGDNSGNTNFTDVTSAVPAGIGAPSTITQDHFGAAFRADYKFFGDWADNTDFTGKNSGKHDFLALGAGVDYAESTTSTTTVTGLTVGPPPTLTSTTAAGVSTDNLRFDVDGTYLMSQNWIAYAEVLGFYQTYGAPGIGGLHYRLDGAELVQLGYFLTPAWQLAGRFDVTEADHRFKTGNQDIFQEIGVGVNYFLGDNGSAGNHAKISADVNYMPQGTPAVAGLDDQAQTNGHDEIVAQLQFQLWL